MAMKQTYDVVYEGGSDEIVEKKSRFIAHVFPVHSEQEAVEHIEQIISSTGMPVITAMPL